MVLVKYHGRLGNQLFQYTRGRILAENSSSLGYLVANPIKGFPGTYEHVGDSLGMRSIEIDGYFQKYEYYVNHKKAIRQWLRFKRLSSQPKDKLIIHVRLGDYLTTPPFQKWIVPMDFYHELIERDKPKSVCFVTDSPNHPYIQQWRDTAEIVSENTLHDFAFLASAKRICVSNSTFSWWAAWLSDAERIYYPDVGYDTFNELWVDDENRYVRMKV